MKVEFKESFARDLKGVKDKSLGSSVAKHMEESAKLLEWNN